MSGGLNYAEPERGGCDNGLPDESLVNFLGQAVGGS